MPNQVEARSMVPTVLVGIGGTGAEVLSRVRRLVEETYGSLKNFPIISFLLVDTDKDYKITNPEAAGSPLKLNEKHWASVSGKQVSEMISNMDNYPWINRWFPNELERNISSLEAGAGQIRACGRFAFFCNYPDIKKKFLDAVNRVKGQENYMRDRHNVNVPGNAINVFVTGSLSGGTGSGMIVDMGYCIRDWIKGEGTGLTTAIVPMPNAFAGINVGDRVLANGYAAMMELSYFSDYRTEYVEQFSSDLTYEVRSKKSPFDFTYLVGTKNGESDFKLEQLREMMAQNIFLDLTSDFAPYKRSIRDNIKGVWAQADPGGRGFPKQFMSFGLSTIEIPIAQIRASLSNRLAKDLVHWWLNESVQLPPQMLELVRGDILKKMRLTEMEMISDLYVADDRSYLELISAWINSIRNEISTDNLLQCTQQTVNIIGSEKGKILKFVDGYLKPKVDAYKHDHFREISPDERLHGDYLKRMYDNRNQMIQRGREALEKEFYEILSDRNRGPQFLDSFIVTVRQIFDDATDRFRREQDQVWATNENQRWEMYEVALRDINEFKDKFGISKQTKMEEYCEKALSNLQGSLVATIQRKARALGLEVIARLQDHLNLLERRFNRFRQQLIETRDYFNAKADKEAESADVLFINGLKLYDRQELNEIYQDLIERLAGASVGSKTPYEIGMDTICSTLSEDILKEASPLWKENRKAEEVMLLFDITEIPSVKDDDFKEKIYEATKQVIEKAPESSKLKTEFAACDRLFKLFNDDSEISDNIRIAFNKSKPLVLLNQAVMRGKDANFTPAHNTNVAILGGRNTGNPAAQKTIEKVKEFVENDDSINPLGEPERHRIVFVQEIGGFSLRCIDGMRELRQSYQDWKGQFVTAKRAQQSGESRDLPIPVHIQKEPPFWDIFPEDPNVLKLVVEARALGVLRQEKNKETQENVIRYTQQTEIDLVNIDIASSWEEAPQVLEVKACRPDREEIQKQITAKLEAAETDTQKQALFNQFKAYLQQRTLELPGGADSPELKREKKIILDVVKLYKLNTGAEVSQTRQVAAKSSVTVTSNTVNPVFNNQQSQPIPTDSTPSQPPTTTPPATIFCTNCGTKNPSNSKFCFKCGNQLVKLN
ncbi:MAG: tubulin-like doman-containing protein [Chroococcales cyanobacterium]